MENILPIVAPVTWLLCGLAFVLFLMNSLRPTRVGGTVASLLLLLATALLVFWPYSFHNSVRVHNDTLANMLGKIDSKNSLHNPLLISSGHFDRPDYKPLPPYWQVGLYAPKELSIVGREVSVQGVAEGRSLGAG